MGLRDALERYTGNILFVAQMIRVCVGAAIAWTQIKLIDRLNRRPHSDAVIADVRREEAFRLRKASEVQNLTTRQMDKYFTARVVASLDPQMRPEEILGNKELMLLYFILAVLFESGWRTHLHGAGLFFDHPAFAVSSSSALAYLIISCLHQHSPWNTMDLEVKI